MRSKGRTLYRDFPHILINCKVVIILLIRNEKYGSNPASAFAERLGPIIKVYIRVLFFIAMAQRRPELPGADPDPTLRILPDPYHFLIICQYE